MKPPEPMSESFLDRHPGVLPRLEAVLADMAEQAVFDEASRRLRDAYRVEFEALLAEVRGEVSR